MSKAKPAPRLDPLWSRAGAAGTQESSFGQRRNKGEERAPRGGDLLDGPRLPEAHVGQREGAGQVAQSRRGLHPARAVQPVSGCRVYPELPKRNTNAADSMRRVELSGKILF